jgi:hypothetical protein
MHKADPPYIANQQCWRKWEYLVTVIDGDAIVDAKQQDTSNRLPTSKKRNVKNKVHTWKIASNVGKLAT